MAYRTPVKLVPNFVAAALIVAFAGTAISIAPTLAEDSSDEIDGLDPRILFVLSGGAWQDSATDDIGDDTAVSDGPVERGYYRAVAYRGDNDVSRLYLQKVALGPDGPTVRESDDIEEISSMNGYITDMRPENSAGASSTQGFTAFVFLKDTPDADEPDMLELLVDEFGDVSVSGASN